MAETSSTDHVGDGLLRGKVAIVYGAGRPIGTGVARAFAVAGAHVVLAGRTLERLEAARDAVERATGTGSCETAVVDTTDGDAVDRLVGAVHERHGRLDVTLDLVGADDEQGTPLQEMRLERFLDPIDVRMRSCFHTATAAARRMTAQGSGTILFLTATSAREWRHPMGGFGVANAAVEALSRSLASEVGPSGVRSVCVRSNFMPESYPDLELPDDATIITDTMLGRLPRIADTASALAFLASDGAASITAAVINASGGAIVD